MDELEVRVHEEINDYSEKFYGLTVRQIIAMIIVIATNVPTYVFLRGKISENILQFLVIFMATPEMFWGFIRIQNMNAERFVRYWWRNFFSFGKNLEYKTDADIEESKKKKIKKKSSKENTLSKTELRIQRKQHKLEVKEAKIKKKADKKARKEARLLAQAQGYFGMEEAQDTEEQVFQEKVSDHQVKKQTLNDDITEEDLRLLQRIKMYEALKEEEEVKNVEEKEVTEESEE